MNMSDHQVACYGETKIYIFAPASLMLVEYLLEKPFCSWVFHMRLSGHWGWIAMVLLVILPSYCHFPFLYLFCKVMRVWLYWLMLSDVLQIITFYSVWAMWALQKEMGKIHITDHINLCVQMPIKRGIPTHRNGTQGPSKKAQRWEDSHRHYCMSH